MTATATHTPTSVGSARNGGSEAAAPSGRELRSFSKREVFGDTTTITHPRDKKIVAGFIEIGPDLAAEFLSANYRNRPMGIRNLGQLTRDMRTGHFVDNGDTFVFDSNGHLSDGQHRCQGIIESGATIWALVVYGVEPLRAQLTMDKGKKRSLSDTLRFEGYGFANHLEATIRLGYQLNVLGSARSSDASDYELIEWFEANMDIEELLPRAGKLARNIRKITPAQITAIVYTGWQNGVPQDDSWAFFEDLSSMAQIPADSPVMALHKYIERYDKQGVSINKTDLVAVTIKSLNFYLAGETITRVSWKSGGRNPEPFPVVRAPSWALAQ